MIGGKLLGVEIERTLSNAGAWVSAVGAGVLLDVHRAAACKSSMYQQFVLTTTSSLLSFSGLFLPIHDSALRLSSPALTYHSVCTERATCCGAFRSWMFPSLLPNVSISALLMFSGRIYVFDVLILAVVRGG